MSSRLHCWARGHHWMPAGPRTYSDIFGNVYKLRGCDQCGATRRVLFKAWGQL
jgi:hypothetical protein